MRLSIYRSKRSGEEILSSENQKLKTILSEASNFIKEIKNGNFNIDISKNLSDNELGVELLSMKLHFDKVSTDEKIRNWFNTGLATFSDILRNKSSLNLKELSDDILSNLVKYISANQGAIFVIENDNNDAEHLRMIACYAYNRKKYLDKRFELGEGLAGQCVLEKEPIYLKEIPEDFVNITSGLGEATPRSVFICPLIINERIFGVIELASLTEFKPHHIDFINKLSENVAACIKNVRDSEQTNTLLNESRQQAEELRAQEEEMRQNLEEMQATQEEMKRKSEELRSTSAEILGIINGINATMATIEFSPDGTIIKANDNFLKTMKYTIDDIKGKHHRMFAPIDVLESDEYKTFWQRLASGESITGVFKRISRTGDTVWLNAIYNPMRNAEGNVVKVIKFATDITSQQEIVAESKGIISGINATMATIEFSPDGTIIKANDNFLKTMKYTIDDIKGKHHRMFAPIDVLESDEYKTFWQRLASGESITGVFKRISRTGDTVWLNAIYNPMRNAEGNVVKVIKFATDITTQQDILAESNLSLSYKE